MLLLNKKLLFINKKIIGDFKMYKKNYDWIEKNIEICKMKTQRY